MVKKTEKEENVTFKSVLNKLMAKSLQSLISVAAEEAEHLTTWIRNLPSIGKKIRHLMTSIILFSAGLGVLGIGIALYIEAQFPNLSKGVPHILVGFVIILVAVLHTKYNE